MGKIKHSIGYDPVSNKPGVASVFTFQLPETPADKMIVIYAGRTETDSFYDEVLKMAEYFGVAITEEKKPNPKWIAAMKRPFWRTLRRHSLRKIKSRRKRLIYLICYFVKIKP
jgi:hypothetical protein